MSPTFHIHVLYHRAVAYWNRLIGLEPPESDVLLLPDITRYFFSEAIDHRIKRLADGVASQEEYYRGEAIREYENRVEQAIRQELKAYANQWTCCAELENRLSKIKLPTHFNDDLFRRRASVIEFMRSRMLFLPGRLAYHEAIMVAGIFLRAVQLVALDIIRAEYPPTSAGTEVPRSVQDTVRRILARVDKFQRLLQAPVELKTLATAETEVRVLVARAKGVVCLPLRSIPTAPLSSTDLEKHYVGRPDEQTLRLARQIRHADGTILVTGYRGVGKSSFVNRIIFHALAAQKEVPSDGWLIVPVTVNLAKVSGVQNILRLTLRSVRDALLESGSRTPRPIPGLDSIPLPLSEENEIEPLEEAYIRATYKVTMSRSAGSERRSELGSSISIDPGKWLGGGKIVGMELGKFLEAGIKKTKTEKINRELSLLDFDENAAEESLGRLIRSLAQPRPLGPDGPNVRIKLVFVFDELDKMDMDTGLKPMIEGLKNLFLQQYSVFMLVTSKGFYYQLLKDRAIEDAMLNSYFSAVVHVPLLSYAQARLMVDDWVDWNATEQLKTKKPAETKLIDQLTRVLVYRSFGNPRDIIRELRLMQDWADTTEQPYLTDRLSKSPNVQIFAALQDCVEKTAVPQSGSASKTDDDGSVTLVSERLVGDEARLEQVRRGLYILTEELINRQTLPFENNSAGPDPDPDKKREPSLLEKIQKDNFSLLSIDDVRQLTKRLGVYLSLIHDNPDLFVTPDWGSRTPLFEMEANELRVNNSFYTLTGRQATVATAEPPATTPETKTIEELVTEAENFALQESWAAKLRAINIIKQIGPEKLTPALKDFLWKVATTDPEPSHRFAAAERLPTKIESLDQINTIAGLLTTEKDERVLSIFLRLLSGTIGDEARKSATDAIVQLLELDRNSRPARKLTEGTAVEALTVLQTVADRDVTLELLEWLNIAGATELIQSTAVSALKKISEQFNVDIAERIISNNKFLALFASGSVDRGEFRTLILNTSRPNNVLKPYLLELMSRNPPLYQSKLLRADAIINVHSLLVYLWELIFASSPDEASRYVFKKILDFEQDIASMARLRLSLSATPGFQARILPDLRRLFSAEKEKFQENEAKLIEQTLSTLEIEAARVIPVQNVFPNIPTFPFTKTSSSSLLDDIDPAQSAVYIVAGIFLFLPGFFFYKADLPSQASLGTTLKSRLLLLALHGLLVYGFIRAFRWWRSDVTASKAPAQNSSFITVFTLLVGATYYLHTTYIGPLHFWSQALQFIINWPPSVALLMAFGLVKPLTK